MAMHEQDNRFNIIDSTKSKAREKKQKNKKHRTSLKAYLELYN